jgi:hypothetical protein
MFDPSNALLLVTFITAFVLLLLVATHSRVRSSANDIVLTLEKSGGGWISRLVFKNGQWKVNLIRDAKRFEIVIDEITGRIIAEHEQHMRERPPRDAMPLSKILEVFAPASVQEIEFDRGRWQIGYEKDGVRRASLVDPVHGSIIADRQAI